jgi:acylphosphatase
MAGGTDTANSGARAVRVRVTGRVQGVSFRYWTRQQAEQLGLRGWVRNEADGSVTALIAGPEAAVASMLEQFWQGPPGAVVSEVVSHDASPDIVPADFRITG